MSKLLWADFEIPASSQAAEDYSSPLYGDALVVPNTKALPIVERNVELPDPRVFRSMSRAAVLLSMVCLRAKEQILAQLAEDPFSVGVYCAVENGPVDFESTKQIVGATKENFAELYKRYRNPKMYLKQLPNLAAAQMGIFMGILGPMHVYNHSKFGCISALEQAELDLETGLVKLALVCSSFSFENPLVVERARRATSPNRIVCEGAGALLLASDGKSTDWQNQDYGNMEEFFGISQQVIELATRKRSV